jgi:AcrR family transcriptional regulator
MSRLRTRPTRDDTRDKLFDAAARVFEQEGIGAASIEAIAAAAGFTRGAFYSNFKSKDELFVELLHARVYDRYAELAKETQEQPGTPREQLRWGAERLRDVQKEEQGSWLFRLWLECLTQAARDEEFRKLAATFWSGNRALVAGQIGATFKEVGSKPPLPPDQLATAMIALDVGLAVQHLVDPDAVSLDVYVPVFDVLFGELVEAGGD